VGDFHQLPPVIKDEDKYIDPTRPHPNNNSSSSNTPNRRSSGSGVGCRTPGQGSGRSAASSGSGVCSGNSSSAQKKRKAPAAAEDLDSDNEDAPPKVPVIMASLPPGFITLTAAERAEWSLRARAQLAAKAGATAAAAAGFGAAGSSGGSSGIAVAAAGSPSVGAFAGGNPKQQQQQQDVDVDMQGSPCKKLCRPGSIKQDAFEDTSDTLLFMQPVQQQQPLPQDASWQCQQSSMQPAATPVAALSPPPQQLQPLLQRMTLQPDPQQLRALGIPAAKIPARQLPAAVQQTLASRKDLVGDQALLRKSRDLGLQMLLLGEAGVASAAAAAGGGAGRSSRSSGLAPETAAAAAAASVRGDQGVREQAVAIQEGDGADDDDEDEWAAVFEPEAALQQQQQQALIAAAAGRPEQKAALQQQQQLARVAAAAGKPEQDHINGRVEVGAAAVAAAAAVPLTDDVVEEDDTVMRMLHCGSPTAAAAAALHGDKLAGALQAGNSTSSDTAAAAGSGYAADASQDTPAAAASAAAGSDGVPAASGLLRLSLGSDHSDQPALLRSQAAAAAGDDDDWEIVDVLMPGEADRKAVVDLAAAESDDEDDVMIDLSSEWQCSQVDCKMQQQQGEVDWSAGAAGSAAVTPVKLKLEQQQHSPAAARSPAAVTPVKLEQQQQQHAAAGVAAASASGSAILTPVAPKLEQQQWVQQEQQQHVPSCNAAAAVAAAAAGAFRTPVKPKLEQQQLHGIAGYTPAAPGLTAAVPPVMVKQEQHQLAALPSALQLAAAATAAAAAAVHHSPGAAYAPRKVLGRDLGYAESGGFPFWRIPSGNIYDRDNTMSPASVHIAASGVSSSSSIGVGAAAGQQLSPGMSPLRPGLTSSSRATDTSYAGVNAAAAGAAAGSDSGRPVLPQWREAAWAKSYCFKSPAWAAAGFKPVVLRQPFRQVRVQPAMHQPYVQNMNFKLEVTHCGAAAARLTGSCVRNSTVWQLFVCTKCCRLFTTTAVLGELYDG
jgi:hypothetical protein